MYKKRFISMAIAVIMVLAMLPVTAGAAGVTSVTIGGVELVSNPGHGVAGATWDGNDTLTLVDTGSPYGLINIVCASSSDTVTINVNGAVTVESSGYAIVCHPGSLTISGSDNDSLTVNSGGAAIHADGSITIGVETTADSGTDCGIHTNSGAITINAETHITGRRALVAGSGDIIINAPTTANGSQDGIVAGNGNIYINDETTVSRSVGNDAFGILASGDIIFGDAKAKLTAVDGGTYSDPQDETFAVTKDARLSGYKWSVSGTTFTGAATDTSIAVSRSVAQYEVKLVTLASASGSMTVGGAVVADLTANGSGTGWTWTADTATLALTNTYAGAPIAIDCASSDTINLTFTGPVSVTNNAAYAFDCTGSLVIGGTGTLTLNYTGSEYYCGLIANRDLTINSGTVTVNSSGSGGVFNGSTYISAAILANCVTIDGNATVNVNATGTDAHGITASNGDITISTSGTVTANGTGTGYALLLSNSQPNQKVTVSSATVNLTGHPVNGRYVNIISGTVTAKDSSQTPLYLVKLTGLDADAYVTDFYLPLGYHFSDMLTSSAAATGGAGCLYIWLPEGVHNIELEADPNVYSNSTVTVAANHSNTAAMTKTANTVVNIAAIPGVTPPVTGAAPVTTVETAQYTGVVWWFRSSDGAGVTGTFAAGTEYETWILMTAKKGYTFVGVAENFFTVAGASRVGNNAGTVNLNGGGVTAVFPATGSGGGGPVIDGGGDTSTSPSATTPTEPPSTVSGDTVAPKTTTDEQTGVTTAAVSEAEVKSAVENAVAAAAETGEAPAVVIDIPAPEGAKTVEAAIPAAAFDAIKNSEDMSLTINAGGLSLTFSSDALSGIAGGDVKITAGIADSSKLTETQQQQVGDRPVYDFAVTSGGEAVTGFGGSIGITLPYAPGADEDPNAIVVYYVAPDGTLKCITNGVYDPATGKVTFTTDHFSLYMIGYNAMTFIDTGSHWAKDSISFVTARGIMNGTGEDRFSPNTTLTRAMLATMLWRLESEPEVEPMYAAHMMDVDEGAYYENAMGWAVKNNIISGYGEGLFGPNDSVTREQLATILYRYIQYKGGGFEGAWMFILDYADRENIADWAYEAVCYCTVSGITGGKPGNLFDPKGTATRAEVATIFARFVEKTVK